MNHHAALKKRNSSAPVSPLFLSVIAKNIADVLRVGEIERCQERVRQLIGALDNTALGVEKRVEYLSIIADFFRQAGKLRRSEEYILKALNIPAYVHWKTFAVAQRLHVKLKLDQGDLDAALASYLEIEHHVFDRSADREETQQGNRTIYRRKESPVLISGDGSYVTAPTFLVGVEVFLARGELQQARAAVQSALSRPKDELKNDDLEMTKLLQALLAMLSEATMVPGKEMIESLHAGWQIDESVNVALLSRSRILLGEWVEGDAPPKGLNLYEAQRWQEFSKLAHPSSLLHSNDSKSSENLQLPTDILGQAQAPISKETETLNDSVQALPLKLDNALAHLAEMPLEPSLAEEEIETLLSSSGICVVETYTTKENSPIHPEGSCLSVSLKFCDINDIIDLLDKNQSSCSLKLNWSPSAVEQAIESGSIDHIEGAPLSGVLCFAGGRIVHSYLGVSGDEIEPEKSMEALTYIFRIALAAASDVTVVVESERGNWPTTIRASSNTSLLLDLFQGYDEAQAGIEVEEDLNISLPDFSESGMTGFSTISALQHFEPALDDVIRASELQKLFELSSDMTLFCQAVIEACRAARLEIYFYENLIHETGRLTEEIDWLPVRATGDNFTLLVYVEQVNVERAQALLIAAHSCYLSMPSRRTAETWRQAEGIHKDLVSASEAMGSLLNRARKLASFDGRGRQTYHVVITGETGVGKTQIARFIHECSSRHDQPFVAENMATISPDQWVATVFGARRGSYTGAEKDRKGLVEAAAGGTFFLDEIGEMSLENQAKLLTLLETGVYRRMGSEETVKADVRFILATNRDIRDTERFRNDLSFRCHELFIPPLRERREDIRPIANFYASKEKVQLSESALVWLEHQMWPGNIRQLQRVIQTAAIQIESGATLTSIELSQAISFGDRIEVPPAILLPGETLKHAVSRYEKDLVLQALKEAGNNVTKAGERLEITYQGLKKKMGILGLNE
jgi:DNA-binding NtrC family response regulator/tetratricopeptide (TPR) repeat protein